MALQDNSYEAQGNMGYEELGPEEQDTQDDGSLNGGSFNASESKNEQKQARKEEKEQQEKAKANSDAPLDPKEQAEVKLVDSIASAVSLGSVPPGTVENTAKSNPKAYRKIRFKVKKLIPVVLAISICFLIFQMIIQAAPILVIMAVVQAAINSNATTSEVAPNLTQEGFYGVRMFYKNDTLLNQKLETNYNQLALEFLQSVGTIEGVESLNITLPENIYTQDLTNYKTDLTQAVVCEIVETIINQQNSEPETLEEGEGETPAEPTTIEVTTENLQECIAQISYFGLSFENFSEISNNVSEFFALQVETTLNTTENTDDDIIIFTEGYTFDKATFTNSLISLWSGENFNKFKVVTEKVLVKDVILKEGETANLSVNGILTQYIYMAKENGELADKRYGMQVAENSLFEISFEKVENGETTVIKSAVADVKWCEKGSDIIARTEGDGKNFISENTYYYTEQLEIEGTQTCSEFTALDKNNTSFLTADDLTIFEAVNSNMVSAQVCFSVAEDETNAGFYTVNSSPNCNYYCVSFADRTQNGTGTPFVFAEVE